MFKPLWWKVSTLTHLYGCLPRQLQDTSTRLEILRCLLLPAKNCTANSVVYYDAMIYISGMISLVGAAVVALVQPYKIKTHNTVDTVLLLLMGIYFTSYLVNAIDLCYAASIFEGMSISLIVLYLIGMVTWKLLHLKLKGLGRRAKKVWTSYILSDNRSEEAIESFTRDRDDSINIRGYSSLLSQPRVISTY